MASPMAEQDPKRQHIAKRRAARKLALIAIYQWQMTGNTYTSIYAGIQEDKELVQDFLRSDAAFFQSLTKYVLENATEVDAQLKPFLDRDAEHLDQIERAVLRMATAELLIHPETPFKVVFLDIAHQYSKFNPTTNKVDVVSNIFKSLRDTKKAYDLKTGVAISTIKEDDDGVKLQKIALTKLFNEDGNEYVGVWYIKGSYLFELNDIMRKYPNDGVLTTKFTIDHEKRKKGRVTYYVPVCAGDEEYNVIDNIKTDTKHITKFNKWINEVNSSSQSQPQTTTTHQETTTDIDEDDIDFD